MVGPFAASSLIRCAGPTVYFPDPLTTLSYTKRKAINLTALQVGTFTGGCGYHITVGWGVGRGA